MIRLLLALLLGAGLSAAQEFRGHGGPVRALAVAPDGALLLSGSFDGSAILWAPALGRALSVWRGHQGAVNAVALLPDGRAVTGGEDGVIRVFRAGTQEAERELRGHEGPVTALAVSADGALFASASWDRTVRLWNVAAGTHRVLGSHVDNANAVVILPDGTVVSAGYDTALRAWSPDGSTRLMATTGAPQNALALTEAGFASAGADGAVRLFDAAGRPGAVLEAGASPVVALAAHRSVLAAAGIAGSVTLFDRESGRVLRSLSGPGLPVWSLAFAHDGTTLFSGGADRRIRRWSVATGLHLGEVGTEPEESPLPDHPGARVFRACAACHALTGGSANRAGPSLAGLFGRRIATLPDFDFSPALRGMDLVWTRETVADLFTRGPALVTPGTRMPEQRVRDPAELEALLDYLETTTRPR